jgi:hypothetical protein
MVSTKSVNKIIQFSVCWLLIAFIMIGVLQVPASAQSTGLRINPRTDVSIRPGETQSGQLLIANLNRDVAITVTLSVIDFEATGETGTPKPLLEEGLDPKPWSLQPYIQVPKSVSLKKGESKYVPYRIRIPNGLGAGSYYSAIKYDPEPAEGSENVEISGAPLQLVFVTIPGRATELLNLEKFGAYDIKEGEVDGRFSSLFISSEPLKFAYTLTNRGNVAESPKGSIIVKNLFGKTVRTIENANPKGNLTLINQTRRIETCIKSEEKTVQQPDGRESTIDTCVPSGLLPGIYTASMDLFYGINGSNTQEINATAIVWYMPYWFLAILLVVIGILAYIIYRIRQRLVGTSSHRRRR